MTNTGKTIAEMKTFGESVETKHNTSISAVTQLSSDRIERDEIYFDNPNSILNRAKRLKNRSAAHTASTAPNTKRQNRSLFKNLGGKLSISNM